MMKPTILIVDDDRSVRDSLKKLLEGEGYGVLTARDSAEAIPRFDSGNIHLVVMDVRLGADDGWAAFERMTATNGSVPTIIVTAEFGQHDRAVLAGAKALIEKPMDVPVFLEIVKRLLASGREKGRPRVAADERCSRHVKGSNDTFRRDLERRYSTPLNMSWFEQLATTHPGAESKTLPQGLPARTCAAGRVKTGGETIETGRAERRGVLR